MIQPTVAPFSPFRNLFHGCVLLLATGPTVAGQPPVASRTEPFTATEPLDWEGDIAARLLDGAHRFVDRKLSESRQHRNSFWTRSFASRDAYATALEPHRERLRDMLGMREARKGPNVEVIVPVGTPVELATSNGTANDRSRPYRIQPVRWNPVGSVLGEGLLLVPDGEPRAYVVFIPDADQTPEMVCGLTEGIPAAAQTPIHMARAGCLVVVPTLVSRERGTIDWHGRKVNFTNREFLYRSAYGLGRHLVGYELDSVLHLVDWFSERDATRPIGLFGYGEGGMLALYGAAIDQRVTATVVSGYVEDRNATWERPLDRNVFGLLEQFGDAELMAMAAPRSVIIEACDHPGFELPPGTGGGPATLETPSLETVEREVTRGRALLGDSPFASDWLHRTGSGTGRWGASETVELFLANLGLAGTTSPSDVADVRRTARDLVNRAERAERLARAIDRHTQEVLRNSDSVRRAFLSELKTSDLDAYAASVEKYREIFRHEIIGHFDDPLLPLNPRSRKFQETEKVAYYEVVLDVFPDLFAYGILCMPRSVQNGERLPVVVCQHGLEGRPQSTIGQQDEHYYSRFATRLAEEGYITFAPQNLYIFGDRFRSLQRKLNPLKKTLFSLIVPQHQQIVNWLKELPQVDPERIAFYGLSYGGKTAMRVPPLVSEYCLSICSADFNEWVDKNVSTRNPRSYVWTGEYEIFEWNLGSTFNYAEMAALIAPRPFMVERGHFDGVADDWTVAWEFAKVRNLYQARLGLGDRCEIEWFVGPHKINGIGTYDFLRRHLLHDGDAE